MASEGAGPRTKEKVMKLLLRTALLAASIGNIGPAHAGDEPVPITQYAEIPGAIIEAHAQDNHHAYPASQGGMQLAQLVARRPSKSG
jgi:hypothetical protein